MVDFADDERTEIERKVQALRITGVVEFVGYLIAGTFWILDIIDAPGWNWWMLKRVSFTVHGVIVMAFVAMVVLLAPEVGWNWKFVALCVLTGPLGPICVETKIRLHGYPRFPVNRGTNHSRSAPTTSSRESSSATSAPT